MNGINDKDPIEVARQKEIDILNIEKFENEKLYLLLEKAEAQTKIQIHNRIQNILMKDKLLDWKLEIDMLLAILELTDPKIALNEEDE